MTMPTYKYYCSVCGIECIAPINVKNMTLCKQHRKEKHILDVRAGAKRQNERERQYRQENPVDREYIECDNNCEYFTECQNLVWQGKPLRCIPIEIQDYRNDFTLAEQSNFRFHPMEEYG
jgi:hypothetical protein